MWFFIFMSINMIFIKYMNIHEQYDDNNLNHVENGPDYGQTYSGTHLTTLAWNVENSFEFKYYDKFSYNQIIIEPIISIDSI